VETHYFQSTHPTPAKQRKMTRQTSLKKIDLQTALGKNGQYLNTGSIGHTYPAPNGSDETPW